MEIPRWAELAVSALAILFFAGHLLAAIVDVRSAPDREARLEAAGAVVPGLSGLLVAASLWLPWKVWRIAAAVTAVPVLVLGRAVYELILFRRGRP